MKLLIIPIALVLVVLSPQLAVSAIPEPQQAASFEVATIKPSDPDDRGGRFMRMQSTQRFEARNYTVKEMIAAAYNLPNRAISGGPPWIDSDRYNILAATTGDERPTSDQQMTMLRALLESRFNVAVHREQKEQPLYALEIAKNGAKLKETTAPPAEEYLINRMFNDNHVLLPARRVTMAQFASMLQRSVLDRAVVDKTGLTGKYDFDLEWTRDESQFGGVIPLSKTDIPPKRDLFSAMQEQLGLRLQSARGPVDVLVIDRADRPSDN
jgi:uncharacterized protein (TIGR03435 family)